MEQNKQKSVHRRLKIEEKNETETKTNDRTTCHENSCEVREADCKKQTPFEWQELLVEYKCEIE